MLSFCLLGDLSGALSLSDDAGAGIFASLECALERSFAILAFRAAKALCAGTVMDQPSEQAPISMVLTHCHICSHKFSLAEKHKVVGLPFTHVLLLLVIV